MCSKAEREQFLEIFDSIDFENIKKHPNILIAAAFWEPERYRAARTAYRFLRPADDLVDNYKSEHPTIGKQDQAALMDNLVKLTGQIGDKSGITANSELAATWEKFLIPYWPVEAFTRSMIYDIQNQGFPTFSSFLEYAEGASVAPALPIRIKPGTTGQYGLPRPRPPLIPTPGKALHGGCRYISPGNAANDREGLSPSGTPLPFKPADHF